MNLEFLEFIQNAFIDGYTLDIPKDDLNSPEESFLFRKIDIGNFKCKSGFIGACDAFEIEYFERFDTNFPKGDFPIELSLGSTESDQRVAFSRILFSKNLPKSAKQINFFKTDEDNESFWVDSATACYYDIASINELKNWINNRDDWYEDIQNSMELVYEHTRSWYLLELVNYNIPFFSSGFGDGTYKSYVAFDENGEIAQLITDFNLFIPDEEE